LENAIPEKMFPRKISWGTRIRETGQDRFHASDEKDIRCVRPPFGKTKKGRAKNCTAEGTLKDTPGVKKRKCRKGGGSAKPSINSR